MSVSLQAPSPVSVRPDDGGSGSTTPDHLPIDESQQWYDPLSQLHGDDQLTHPDGSDRDGADWDSQQAHEREVGPVVNLSDVFPAEAGQGGTRLDNADYTEVVEAQGDIADPPGMRGWGEYQGSAENTSDDAEPPHPRSRLRMHMRREVGNDDANSMRVKRRRVDQLLIGATADDLDRMIALANQLQYDRRTGS